MSETPSLYASPSAVHFVEQEVRRPSKQWITSIIDGVQEKDQVILRTDDFVLLPDTERVNRYGQLHSPTPITQTNAMSQWRRHTSSFRPRAGANMLHHDPCIQKPILNWLGIALDMRLRTLRDLRGEHVPMLQNMLDAAMATIESHAGIPREQVMAYVHYPPSVYQLHVHFSFPYGQYCHRDTYRVHSLQAIINNLHVDPSYYVSSTLFLAMFRHSQYYQALFPPAEKIQAHETDETDATHATSTRKKKGA